MLDLEALDLEATADAGVMIATGAADENSKNFDPKVKIEKEIN